MTKSILIIEDDDGIREALKDLLEFEGYQTHTARNGLEGLQFLQKQEKRPDLILLDLMMPVMDGWEFLNIQSQDTLMSDIPVVVISAAGDQAEFPIAQAFVKKPIHLDHFIGVVKNFCS